MFNTPINPSSYRFEKPPGRGCWNFYEDAQQNLTVIWQCAPKTELPLDVGLSPNGWGAAEAFRDPDYKTETLGRSAPKKGEAS